MSKIPYSLKDEHCFDGTSLKVNNKKFRILTLATRSAGILAMLIFSTFIISACSGKVPSVTEPQNTSTPVATVAAFSTPPATPARTPTPAAGTAAVAASSPAPTPTPATTVVPQPVAITAASEELSERGFDEYNQFRYDNAINFFNQAISADPNNYKAYNGKGIALCFKGSYSSGMPLIQKSLDMKPDYSYGHFNMAMAYKLQKDYDNSLTYFNKALSLDPKDTWSYYGIATIYADRGDINASLGYLKKAIDLDPAVKEVAREQDHFQPYLNNQTFIEITK